MRRDLSVIAVIALTLILIAPTALPATDADDDYKQNIYGTDFGLQLEQIDQFLVDLFGKTLKEILDDTMSDLEGYDIEFNPTLTSQFGVLRNTYETDDEFIYTDQVSGYIMTTMYVTGSGPFPEEGEYDIKEGEDYYQAFKRVLNENHGPQRNVDVAISLGAFLDFNIATRVDKATGELSDIYCVVKAMILSNLSGSIKVTIPEEAQSFIISYDKYSNTGNGYLDFEVEVTADELMMLNDAESWHCNPTIKTHITAMKVSADLADSVWNVISKMIHISQGKERIPELILDIITTSTRPLDVFDVIKSLTSTDVPDMYFTADINLSNTVGDDGNKYVSLDIKRGEGSNDIRFPLGGYTLDLTRVVNLIPEKILSNETKIIIDLALVMLGWNDIEVSDITDDQQEQDKIYATMETVDEAIIYDETYEFKIPTKYVITAAIISILIIGAVIYFWRVRP